MEAKAKDISKTSAIKFLLLLSFVSLCADMTYEGARSITGPYLAILGANAAIVGFVAGFGEMVGYTLRIFSGYAADRTGKYWTITIIGYTINLLSVPLLAIVGNWQLAALLIILERFGKAIRIPSRDAMLSHAGHKIGMGWGFGLHEAFDRLGAMLGPIMIAVVLFYKGSYQQSFALLLVPALFALIFLFIARFLYPRPQSLEIEQTHLSKEGMNFYFWLYLIGAALIAAGYTDFPLMAYHFQKTSLLSPMWIPVAYGLAVGINALAAPLLGHYYDRKGFIILILVTLLSCLFAPFVFLGTGKFAFVGIALWGMGVCAQESLMRAIVANMVPANKRASAYGIFNAAYGVSWFLGSVLMGVLYDISIVSLVIFSVTVQLSAVPLFLVVLKHR